MVKMGIKTLYLSDSVWRKIDPNIRRAILSVLPFKRSELVGCGKFISTLENELRIRNEHELANKLLECLEEKNITYHKVGEEE